MSEPSFEETPVGTQRPSPWARFIKMIEVELPEGVSGKEMLLENKDLLPVPFEERTWHWYNYFTFWIADSFNINTFMIASSMLSASGGLNWWRAWLAVWTGYIIAAVFLALNAYPGGLMHIVFPSYCRASFGIWGAIWPVINRIVMAIIWFSVQSYIGAEAMYVFLRAVFTSFTSIPDAIGDGQAHNGSDKETAISTARFLAFFLFWLVQLIPIWFPLHQIRHFFTLKAFVAPAAGLALFGWCIHRAGGAGTMIHEGNPTTGSQLAWSFIYGFMGCIANMATLITNAVDFGSRAYTPKATVWPQLISLPMCFGIVSLFGILIASSSRTIFDFDHAIWDPVEVLDRFMDLSYTTGTRAGCAFIALGFIIAQIGTNIAANTISAGCDLTSLAPRFITIRRGGYICAFIGLALVPWKLLQSFTTYLSAYSVFLSSIIGVLIPHYYIVSRRQIALRELYNPHRTGLYFYFWGFNLRAYVAYICGILINVVGFAGEVKPENNVPIEAIHIYQLNFFTGFGVSAIIYVILNLIFPTRMPTDDDMMDNYLYTKDPVPEQDSVEYGEGVAPFEYEFSKGDDTDNKQVYTSVESDESNKESEESQGANKKWNPVALFKRRD